MCFHHMCSTVSLFLFHQPLTPAFVRVTVELGPSRLNSFGFCCYRGGMMPVSARYLQSSTGQQRWKMKSWKVAHRICKKVGEAGLEAREAGQQTMWPGCHHHHQPWSLSLDMNLNARPPQLPSWVQHHCFCDFASFKVLGGGVLQLVRFLWWSRIRRARISAFSLLYNARIG